jgi:hypothetical protein
VRAGVKNHLSSDAVILRASKLGLRSPRKFYHPDVSRQSLTPIVPQPPVSSADFRSDAERLAFEDVTLPKISAQNQVRQLMSLPSALPPGEVLGVEQIPPKPLIGVKAEII